MFERRDLRFFESKLAGSANIEGRVLVSLRYFQNPLDDNDVLDRDSTSRMLSLSVFLIDLRTARPLFSTWRSNTRRANCPSGRRVLMVKFVDLCAKFVSLS